jgi:ribosomal protein S12 methylthiotransferase
MGDQVPDPVKRARFDELMQAQREIAAAHQRGWVGRRVEVLVEGASEESEHLLAGRTSQQAPEIDGVTYLNEVAIPGQEGALVYPGEIVTAEVTDAGDYDLVARVVAREGRSAGATPPRQRPAGSGLRVLG